MATLSEAQAIGLVSLALILSGAVIVTSMSNSYYCQPEDNVKECIKLSSTKVTCYTAAGGDRCTGGVWQPLESFVKQKKLSEVRSGYFFTRDPNGKTCYEYGSLSKAVSCSEAEKKN